MTYRTVRRTSIAEACIALIVTFAVSLLIDMLGAWMVMAGLHGMNVRTGFWPCFMVLCGISTAVAGSAGARSSRS